MKIDVFEKIRSQDASWGDLGPIWVPKGVQDGGLLGPKLVGLGAQDGASDGQVGGTWGLK